MVSLLWPGLVAGLAVGLVAIGLLAWWAARRRRRAGPLVAHTAWLRELPQVRAALVRDRVWQTLGAVGLVVALVGATAVAGRPVERTPATQQLGRRDIVLCLDVSGSMTPYDSQIVKAFESMVRSFDGERIALSVFNATSRTVFPLTDDYDMVLDELAQVGKGLDVDLSQVKYVEDLDTVLTPAQKAALMEVWAGTLGVNGSSLIGDGLANCSLLFDDQSPQRSRSIILATDNGLYGDPVYTLDQAVDLARSRSVSLYGLFPKDLQGSEQDLAFARSLTAGGGKVWYAEDPSAVSRLVADVVADQASVVVANAPPRVTDRQGLWVGLAGGGLVLLLLARFWGRR